MNNVVQNFTQKFTYRFSSDNKIFFEMTNAANDNNANGFIFFNFRCTINLGGLFLFLKA